MDWKDQVRKEIVIETKQNPSWCDALCYIDYEKLESFIENLLEQERKRVEDESIALSPPEYIREPMMVSAFNDGVRAVLSIINKK